ncbi:hypothetical protein KGF54_002709 [Candida jiufengensis]|uniref:uncharacterized protein n=1 Tax=Candida jiufengensis TaxID=497108 RepID=UPI0022253C63|nr:uncharacterized protein KGF54_002709 [Candida jiufengensis]KAI5953338.1 hypothetical protein KGF54_002709 [Candida jiufengensis]
MSDKDKKKLQTKLYPLFENIYKHEYNGIPISTHFHALPPRTGGGDYYKVIKNPISLHKIGAKLKKLDYNNAQEFINDLALISFNARYYNMQESIIYKHAESLKKYIEDTVIPKLKNDKHINDNLIYPILGELPEEHQQLQENSPPVKEEYEMSATPTIEIPITRPDLVSAYNRQSSFTTPKKATTIKQQQALQAQQEQLESGIRRGRPPIIDKPFESRIKQILKGFKKLRDDKDRLLIKHFDKLPDSKNYPDYYNLIKNPMSLAEIRIKVRSRKYTDVDQFINDLDLMFANFQQYFQRDPYGEEFLDYQQFKKEANQIVQNELNKSDKDVLLAASTSSDGIVRYPLEELKVDGYSYRIGDWVLMKNPADSERPIVGQIFRIWSTEDGKKYCNMCWYYRPEQTCHGVDRIFFQNEVCKTGQYRDHLIDDIVGPCYVLFLTRYQKGDLPSGVIPSTAPWFICEFRYNETTHVFNRIRTWKACLPDEVREDDEQPLIQLNETRKLIKFESPIRSFFDPNLEMGEIPDAVAGTTNSPPIRGSVYKTAPIPTDDLGQYTTSPNVVSVPEHDDKATGRHAYLFTPISQLKGGGGSTNAVYSTTSSLPHGSPNHESTKLATNAMSPPVLPPPTPVQQIHQQSPAITDFTEEKPQLPNSYVSIHDQIQENQIKKLQDQQQQQQQQQQLQQHQQQSPPQQQPQQLFKKLSTPTLANIVPTDGGTFYNAMPTFSQPNGALAYGLQEDLELPVNKKLKSDPTQQSEIIFYRSPPIQLLGNRIITNSKYELGHSAKYLAWKNDKKNNIAQK